LLAGLLGKGKEGFPMSKEDAILHYRTAMAVFRNWLDNGVITNVEFLNISADLARKYGLSTRSIFLETACNVGKTE
jgi:hypothetical protein